MDVEQNPNIQIMKDKDEDYYISFIPYNREITADYIKYWLQQIIKKFESFVLFSNDFVFDGLNETNKTLIKNGCIIQCVYTGQYRTFKGE